MRQIIALLLLVSIAASCAVIGARPTFVQAEHGATAPIIGHTDAELQTISQDRNAIKDALARNQQAGARLLVENHELQAADRQLAVKEAQTRFLAIAILSLFAAGVLYALSIYGGSFMLVGFVLAPILRIGAIICAAIAVLAFACDWLAPYAWYLGLIIPAAVIGLLIWLLRKSHAAKQVMADSWFAATQALEHHNPEARAKLDAESLAAQTRIGVKTHIDSILHRI